MDDGQTDGRTDKYAEEQADRVSSRVYIDICTSELSNTTLICAA